MRFSDRLGVHHVVVTETEIVEKETEDGVETRSKWLYGYHFTRQPEQSEDASSWKLLWRTQDFVRECELDLVLSYVPQSLAISDVDGDGIQESRFAYRLGCFGDLSPLTLKLLFHEGKQKLAVRGTTRVEVGLDEKGRSVRQGGERTFDPAFAKAPKGLKAFAEREWERLLVALEHLEREDQAEARQP